MKKLFLKEATVLVAMLLGFCSLSFGADVELAQKSIMEQILLKKEIRVGFEAGYMPFAMKDKKGEFVGFDIDIAKLMAEAMGVKLMLVNTTWNEIIPALVSGKFDIIMSGMTVTQERNLKINFVDPYIIVGQAILLNKKHERTVKSYKDLNDPKYIVTSKRGTTGEQAVKNRMPNCKYTHYETETDAFLEVLNDKADAYVFDKPNCVVFMAQHGATGKIVFLDEPFTYEPIAWAVNKGDPDFLNWLNNFLRQIKNDGRYDDIYIKWIKSNEWYKDVK